MDQITDRVNFEIRTKRYTFHFYSEQFECYWKSAFVRKSRTIYFKDIVDISSKTEIINFMPFYTYTFKIKNQKNFKLEAVFNKQMDELMPVIEYIKKCRAAIIMRSASI